MPPTRGTAFGSEGTERVVHPAAKPTNFTGGEHGLDAGGAVTHPHDAVPVGVNLADTGLGQLSGEHEPSDLLAFQAGLLDAPEVPDLPVATGSRGIRRPA